MRIFKWVLITISWLVFAGILLIFLILPWRTVVSDTGKLLLLLILPTVGIATCSASELALISQKPNPNAMQDKRTENYKKQNLLKYLFSQMWQSVGTDRQFANVMIVMANTVLAIYMTVSIGHCLKTVPEADAFTIFGVTITLFLFGETIPKQLAITKPTLFSKVAQAFLVILFITVVIPLVSKGIAYSFPKQEGG